VELESQFGPFDPSLQEPLGSMERLFGELGDFERVREIQSRRLQLLRTSRGLEHPDIIPLVEAIVRTEIQLGNWVEISDHLEHLRTLALANYGNDSPELMAALERQADWYLARVYLDEDRERADNYMESRELYDDLLDMAEDNYGEDDPQLIPWLYKRAYSLYQQVGLLNSEGSLRSRTISETVRRDGEGRLQSTRSRGFGGGFSLIDPFNRIPVTENGEPVGVAYLRLASGYIDDIRDIAEAEGDWETWAMATLYHGDYSLLRGRNSGRGSYREAIEKLEELGYSSDRLEQFFNQPMLIPVAEFYSRFDEFEAQHLARVGGLQPVVADDFEVDADEPWDAPVHAGVFYAWEESAGAVAMPVLRDPLFAMNLPYHQVDMEFRVNSRGVVSGVDVLQTEPEETRVRRRAVRIARDLRFRPALYEGRARHRPVVQLRYRILPEDD
ncbi:MAG: hypothetical protein MI746_14340, partial [Pseudomonadales bacterium]|nr:hypothetical protein [Pseudomonadales bacterium]